MSKIYSTPSKTQYDYNSPICMSSNLEQEFNKNIVSALKEAMSIKTEDMSQDDFKSLVLFILNFKCNL